jgi:hypothetical protein
MYIHTHIHCKTLETRDQGFKDTKLRKEDTHIVHIYLVRP